jgi:hypothetical protein
MAVHSSTAWRSVRCPSPPPGVDGLRPFAPEPFDVIGIEDIVTVPRLHRLELAALEIVI